MPVATKTSTSFRIVPIKLDANGDLPTRFPLFVTGNWPNSVKGNMSLSLEDLKQIKEHYDAGIGFPTDDASTGLAIDYFHEFDRDAAAWFKGLELEADEATGKGTLYANPVEWTTVGADAIRDGRVKCVSPMGAFGSRDGQPIMWQKANDLTYTLPNVLEGAGLTNIPFLQGMPPIRADAKPDGTELPTAGMVFVRDEDNNKEKSMNLDQLRLKDKEALSADELAFVTDHKAELSTDERVRLGFETITPASVPVPAPAVVPAPTETLSAEDKVLLAAIKSGSKKVVDATTLETLSRDTLSAEDKTVLASIKSGDKQLVDAKTVEMLGRMPSLLEMEDKYRHDQAERVVMSHVERGAIKPTEKDNWTKMLLDASADTRTALEASLTGLPSNELLAKEIGHNQEVVVNITEELKQKTLETMSKAKAAGETLTYAQSQERLMRDDPAFKERYEAERKNK